MQHKTQLIFIATTASLLIVAIIYHAASVEFNGCGIGADCWHRLVTSVSFAPYFVPGLALLFSLIPLLFTSERAYRTWRSFAIIAVPVMALVIYLAPAHAPGDYITIGFDREIAALFTSALFVLISWAITFAKR